ncbi:Uncharacterised protein [Klebsiella pneumoniae]|nr:Uncharacterised protein [Klebsiella pneumoniae]
MTPVWRNDELEEAVIGALFLRGDDPEVLDFSPDCLQAPSQFVSIGEITLASADRPAAAE